ncbi:PLP-dependent transferase [Cylindrobasidium torrendii FP15055 ss-10]|uniref:sphinganine-1-phosphate aldolase n=1 Tax=Cylindrobasidium torrendii FP15055 ss-10 TaxID=1314674 RepID=A0A0D7AU52_9AGAR|nr:PLP-dependent transferase [Cylindrobasidium torrendii FP15055 ss-10]
MSTALAKQRLTTWTKAILFNPAVDNAKTILFLYFFVTHLLRVHRHIRARGIVTTGKEIYTWCAQRVIFLLLRLPSARDKVTGEMAKARVDIESKLVPRGEGVVRHLSLPEQGKSLDWILEEMAKMDAELENSTDYRHGKLSGAVYHGGDEMDKVIVAAYARYTVSNPIHPDVFPAVRKMEAEIVSQVLRLFNNPDGAGTMTSGGTESIVMSVKTHRDWARATKNITRPEMIIPDSAHAAFDKAAEYFGVKVHVIPVDRATRRVDIKRVKRAINANTIMLVGSSVNFPDGNQDDITALGALATAYNLGLHVDCCLGSFIVAYLEKAGLAEGTNGRYKLLPFDFRVPGVTAISCDTHKYGFAPKGTSVIMYRNAALREYQYYVYPDWMGGVYGSPSFSGSRPGALIAGAWAAMQYMGSEGYLQSCREIVTCARRIADTIRETIPELYVMGDPPASVVAFASKHPKVNILEVGDKMSQRGWHLNALNGTPGVHLACTRLTVQVADEFIADLKDAVSEAKASPSGKGTMVALYGLGNSSAVGPSMVRQLATTFLDTLYKA